MKITTNNRIIVQRIKIKWPSWFKLLLMLSLFGSEIVAQNIFNEMEITDVSEDEDVKSTIIRDPEQALLIVKTQISQIELNSNNEIIQKTERNPGIWHLQLVPGTHRLTFQAPGFISFQKRFYFNPKEVKGIKIVVVSSRDVGGMDSTGILILTSAPDSAQVLIDNEPFAFTNYIGRFATGTYRLTLQKQYYQNYIKDVTVTPGAIVPVNVDLQPLLGSMTIGSYPDSALVILDTDTIGRTPFLSNQIPYGKHDLSIDLPDYISFDTTITINSMNPLLRISKRLRRSVAFLNMNVRPANSEIFIDGKFIQRPVVQDYPLNYGQHTVEVMKRGYYAYDRTFIINRSDPVSLNIDLEPKSKTSAVLFSMVIPGTGQYYSGNKSKGIFMSVTFITCLAGGYILNSIYEDERKKFQNYQSVYEQTIDVNLISESHSRMMNSYDKMKNMHDFAAIAAACAGTIWLYSLFDNLFFFPAQEERSLSVSTSVNAASIEVIFNF